jgi:hypothetical protein
MQVQTFHNLSRRVLATLSAADHDLTVDEVAERAGLTDKCARDVLRGLGPRDGRPARRTTSASITVEPQPSWATTSRASA